MMRGTTIMECTLPKWPEGSTIDFRDWHFHYRLWERYKIRFLPGEYELISHQIKNGIIEEMPRSRNRGCAIYKYTHQPNTPNQTRIYVLAEYGTGKLVSVRKPNWVLGLLHKKSKQPSPRLRKAAGKKANR